MKATFDLNLELAPIKDRWSRSPEEIRQSIRERLDNGVLGKMPKGSVITRRPQMAADAEAHDSFLYALSDAYSQHRDISFGPHDLWYWVLTEIAAEVNANPSNYRDIFTKSPEKVHIAVFDSTGSAYHPETTFLPIDLIINELKTKVPVDLSLFLPQFSTNTPSITAANMAAFCDMVKAYYSYGVYCCGIRSIDVQGTVDDWTEFGDRLAILQPSLAGISPKYFTRVRNRVAMIRDSLQGGDTSFYQNIYTQKNIGSGSELQVSGWITEFVIRPPELPKINNFSKAWSVVPFTNHTCKTEHSEVYGCFFSNKIDGRHFPDYSNYTIWHKDGIQ